MTFEVTPQDNCLYFLKIIILRRFSCWLEADTGMQLENLLTLRLVANWGYPCLCSTPGFHWTNRSSW